MIFSDSFKTPLANMKASFELPIVSSLSPSSFISGNSTLFTETASISSCFDIYLETHVTIVLILSHLKKNLDMK